MIPTTPGYDEFVASIIATLNKNGYPERRVSLPLERMYEVAYNKKLNFNKALTLLGEQGISHEKAVDKIIFFPRGPRSGVHEAAAGMAEMMAKANDMLKAMSPEQLAELRRTVEGMSDEDKAEMLKKAKELGIAPTT